MSDQLPRRRSLFAVWRWPKRVLIPLALLMTLGYPLSIGPVVSLANRSDVSDNVAMIIEAFYFPIVIACEYIQPLDRLLNAYLEWWG